MHPRTPTHAQEDAGAGARAKAALARAGAGACLPNLSIKRPLLSISDHFYLHYL
jgi:hypothetical protein